MKLKQKTVVILSLSVLAACSNQDHQLPFISPQGDIRQMRLFSSEERKLPRVEIENRTLQVQRLGKRNIMLTLNGNEQWAERISTHHIQQLELYELGQSGFVDVYWIHDKDLCRSFRNNKIVKVSHGLTFYQQDFQRQPRLFGLISHFDLQRKKPLAKLNSSRTFPENKPDYLALLHGSARKIHSFLDKLICQ